jgi:hypothetical protein
MVRPSVFLAELCLLGVVLMGLGSLGAVETSAQARLVPLRAPLATIVKAAGTLPEHPRSIVATVVIPEGAPADLGVGAWLSQHDGRWFQRLHPQRLSPGRHELRFLFKPGDPVNGEHHGDTWSALAGDLSTRGGLVFFSEQVATTAVEIERLTIGSAAAVQAVADEYRLIDLSLPLDADGAFTVDTGARTTLSFRADPMPANPYDPNQFRADAIITAPDGHSFRLPAFYRVPMAISDRGDTEQETAADQGRYEVRFRPQSPGAHQVRLELRWSQPQIDPRETEAPAELSLDLPDLGAEGEAWNDYVRRDSDDQRFFSIGDERTGRRFYWPCGLNIRSVNDPRGLERTGSKLTPIRIEAAYEAYLHRLAASGANAVEIWMSSWNLALEWRGDWPGYGGLGRYNQANAERMDRLLDLAHELGIRVNLVVRNHGQCSEKTDREWHNSPYNSDNGGVVQRANQFFADPTALAYQDRLRRYLVGRYADHPAILGWKLWSEQNLTAGGGHLPKWHARAGARWEALDPYQHPVTTHWSGDYRKPSPAVASLPVMDYLCIDAYHGRREGRGIMLAQLVWDSTQHPRHGMARYEKPIIITEYGGNWNAAPMPQLLAEHASGPWAALISGHAGSPMLWWFEMVDQQELWGPYRAVQTFLAGEDLRGSNARAVRLQAGRGFWAGAWLRPGRLLGYLADQRWAFDGRRSPSHTEVDILIGDQVKAGTITVEWWNADQGDLIERTRIEHPGGTLRIRPPAFQRHIAFKLARD